MMGSGKTYWAQQLAAALGIDWADVDAEIQKENLQTIAEIFETIGEKGFRQKEQMALRKLGSYQNIIIATGGGTPCFNNNMQWMNEHGTTIWIDEPIEVLVKRLLPEKAHRPLIKNLKNEELPIFLQHKLKERKPFYSQATFRVNSKGLNIENLLQLVQ
jgi:shikimate kinase